MPIGRYKIHRGVTAPTAAGALPQISVDPIDAALLSIVDAQGQSLLRYDIRPQELAPSDSFALTGRDRVSGKTILQSRTAATRIDADAAFNGHPVIDFGAGSGATAGQSTDLRLDAPPPASFTGFVVAAISSSLKTTPATARLIGFVRGTSNFAYLTLLSDGRLIWGNSLAGAQIATIPAASLPAANVPFVIGFSYNRVTGKVRIYLNGAFVSEGTVVTPIETDASVKIGLGGPAGVSTGNGWSGRESRLLTMFESELPDVQTAFISAALRTKYGIA